ncbi:MAG: M20/M25/M40 family metallo-hydrolase [Anaerolineae bacterium]
MCLVSGLERYLNRIGRFTATSVIGALRSALDARLAGVLDEALTIQQIPSPTFDECRRAEYVLSRFKQIPRLDPKSIRLDDLYNVYACLPGTAANGNRRSLLISAHTDTVFDRHTPLQAVRHNGVISAPGIGDNSLGVAALITAAEVFGASHAPRLPADLWFVANSREEGMGDLGGIKAVYAALADNLTSAIVLEGMALGHVYIGGIAVRRYRITCRTAGGHSWLHFGRPSAIHHLMRLGAQLASVQPSHSPRTTYNIGVVEGGQSVNTIAASASFLLDLRSETREGLALLEGTVHNLITMNTSDDVRFEVQVVGDRPSGRLPRTHPLAQLAQDTLQYLGITPVFESGSTDANVLLAAGLPTITIGITRGGNAHRTDEYIEAGPIQDGLWQLILLIAGVAQGLA